MNLDFSIAPPMGVVERLVSKARIAEHMDPDVLLAELRWDGDPNPAHFSYIQQRLKRQHLQRAKSFGANSTKTAEKLGFASASITRRSGCRNCKRHTTRSVSSSPRPKRQIR
ncbi:MAG: hypothetical protein DMG97_27610 [Acidobacteria bacterium]|nr:MAG: hypothetical protein DMG97_27610 [Acidobacteriota bacterium]